MIKLTQFIVTILVTTLIVVASYEIGKEPTKLEKEKEALEFYKIKMERIKIASELKLDLEYKRIIKEVDSIIQAESKNADYAEFK